MMVVNLACCWVSTRGCELDDLRVSLRVVLKGGRLVVGMAALMDDKKDNPTGGHSVVCLAELTAACSVGCLAD